MDHLAVTVRAPFEDTPRSISAPSCTVSGINSTPKRRYRGLDGSELADAGGRSGIPKDRDSRDTRRNLFEPLNRFPLMLGTVRVTCCNAPTAGASGAYLAWLVRVQIRNHEPITSASDV